MSPKKKLTDVSDLAHFGLTHSSFWNFRAMALQRSENSFRFIYKSKDEVQQTNQKNTHTTNDSNHNIFLLQCPSLVKNSLKYKEKKKQILLFFQIIRLHYW